MSIKAKHKFISNWSIVLFIAVWAVSILFDYINKHPSYLSSIEYFQYPKLYSFLLVVIGTITYFLKKGNKSFIPVNGLTITILCFILSFALIVSHKDYAYSSTSMTQVWSFQFSVWAMFGFVFIMIMIIQSAGNFVFEKLLKDHIKANRILEIGLGFMLFISLLFLLGLFGLFNAISILVVLVLFMMINFFQFVDRLRGFFFKPIDLGQINRLGIISFCVLLYFMLLNALSIYGPYPSGFDSRNFYMNVSQLIAENETLVRGYQPYYWSILMAVGYAFFEKVELAMELSILGMVLTLMASYRFAHKILKLDKNIILFCLCLFVVTPAVTNQLYTELKVDFALLFYQILCVEYLIVLINKVSKTEDADSNKSITVLAVLIGLLCGFGLGIKMINMFLVFVILVLVWWQNQYKIGLVAALSFALLLFLIAGIDDISGLSKYHLSSNVVKLILAIVFVFSSIYLLLKQRSYFIRRSLITAMHNAKHRRVCASMDG